ncbi:MAG TPA: regulatory iron-sulfur-containing complex subunit RicT, partial [Bacillus sp. (in: firmicutes)]|nr:regulatory iron-sulfur-containing complex subunit RicT [Bacillus sp. (in: firmicutes)]
NLSLNPTKISGLCGRLMCCLKYENDEYETSKKLLPDIGKWVDTPLGSGKVVGLNILERLLQVDIPKQERVLEFTLDEILKEDAVSVQSTD